MRREFQLRSRFGVHRNSEIFEVFDANDNLTKIFRITGNSHFGLYKIMLLPYHIRRERNQ